jgi:hypothetical protein
MSAALLLRSRSNSRLLKLSLLFWLSMAAGVIPGAYGPDGLAVFHQADGQELIEQA